MSKCEGTFIEYNKIRNTGSWSEKEKETKPQYVTVEKQNTTHEEEKKKEIKRGGGRNVSYSCRPGLIDKMECCFEAAFKDTRYSQQLY